MPKTTPELNIRTALCLVDAGEPVSDTHPEGRLPSLAYCGYKLESLMADESFAGANDFERTFLLLQDNELPDETKLRAFQTKIQSRRQLPDFLKRFILSQTEFVDEEDPFLAKKDAAGSAAEANDADKAAASLGMSRLSAITTLLQTRYEWDESQDNEATEALFALLPTAIIAWHHLDNGTSLEEFEAIFEEANQQRQLAGFMLHCLLKRIPEPHEIAAFNAILQCYAEHGMNASTTVACASKSTKAPMAFAISAAINTLVGPLHGRANLDAGAFLSKFNNIAEIDAYLVDFFERDAINKANGTPREKIHGFGHAVYKFLDPRSPIIKNLLEQLLAADPERLSLSGKPIKDSYAMAQHLETRIWEAKHLPANVDFYMSVLLEALHIPHELFTVTFALGRLSGWCAHAKEYSERQGPLIRLKDGMQIHLTYDGRPAQEAEAVVQENSQKSATTIAPFATLLSPREDQIREGTKAASAPTTLNP